MTTLNEKVRNLLEQGAKKDCEQIQIVKAEGKIEHVCSTMPVDKDSATDLAFVERVCLSCADEVEDLADNKHATFILRMMKEGRALMFERARVPGRAARPASIVSSSSVPGSSPGPLRSYGGSGPTSAADVIVPEVSGSEFGPGASYGRIDVAVLTAGLRQQMRHNEALVGQIVSLTSKIQDPAANMIKTLGDALGEAQKELLAQAKQTREMIQATRVMEAEARTAEHKAKAIDRVSEQLARFLPMAANRIMARYGLKEAPGEGGSPAKNGAAPANGKAKANGSSGATSYEQRIAVIVHDLIRSIMERDQLMKLAAVMGDDQMAMLAALFEAWDANQQATAAADAAAKKDESKPAS